MATTELTELQKAQMRHDTLLGALNYAENRNNTLSSKFIDLEIQIASIVIGILGATALLGSGKEGIEPIILWAIFVSFCLLLISIILGLYSIHTLGKFWNGIMKKHRMSFDVWREFLLNGGGDYKQAEADCRKMNASPSNIVESANWPYTIQTISLALGIIIPIAVAVVSVLTK